MPIDFNGMVEFQNGFWVGMTLAIFAGGSGLLIKLVMKLFKTLGG